MLFAVIVAGATVLVLRRSLTRPLSTLTGQVQQVARGDLDRPVQPSGPPELVAVAEAVESMRLRILTQTQEAALTRQQFALYEEADRIAQGLHHRVIQRLFGMGLSVQSIANRHPGAAPALSETIDEIDQAIQEIRAVIVGLSPQSAVEGGIRQQVLDVVADSERTLGFTPRVYFAGRIDETVPDEITKQLMPALRETLANVAGNAHARRVEVNLEFLDRALVLQVTNDNPGVPAASAGTDGTLRGVRQRAELLGGTCAISTTPHVGTTVDWRVPVQRDGLTRPHTAAPRPATTRPTVGFSGPAGAPPRPRAARQTHPSGPAGAPPPPTATGPSRASCGAGVVPHRGTPRRGGRQRGAGRRPLRQDRSLRSTPARD
jgi:signal transduction histidine kinase